MRGTSPRFCPVIAFGGPCWTAFLPLLQRQNERALLLLAYLLVLVGSVSSGDVDVRGANVLLLCMNCLVSLVVLMKRLGSYWYS